MMKNYPEGTSKPQAGETLLRACNYAPVGYVRPGERAQWLTIFFPARFIVVNVFLNELWQ